MAGLAAILLLLRLSQLAAEAVESSAVMRKHPAGHKIQPHQHHHAEGHKGHAQVHLGPSGEVHQATAARHPVPTAAFLEAATKRRNDDCNVDFVLGTKDTTNCTSVDLHSLILRPSLCEVAANESGATIGNPPGENFIVDYDHEELYPMGCFEHETLQAFYFNPIGHWHKDPAKITGSPVCQRVKYANGTENENDGCPADYTKILSRDDCISAAECQGICVDEQTFLWGLEDPENNGAPERTPHGIENYNGFPKGCFIHVGLDGCAHFNGPDGGTNPDPTGQPTAISGVPMCKVAQPYSIDGAAA